jgi:hypothetical protein
VGPATEREMVSSRADLANLRDRLTICLLIIGLERLEIERRHEAAYGDEHDDTCPLCGADAQP